MNILYICNEYPPAPHGGTGVFVKTIAERLAQKGHQIYVFGVYPNLSSTTQSKENEVTIIKAPLRKEKGFTAVFKLRRSFAKEVKAIVKKYKIDLVEVPDSNAWFLFFNLPVPVCIRLHNGERYFTKELNKSRGRLTWLIEQLSFLRKDKIIAVSEFIKRKFAAHFLLLPGKVKKSSVIYNGIDLALFPSHPIPFEERSKRILFAGTLKPIKGIDKLIEAFASITESIPDYELWIYGNSIKIEGKAYKDILIEQCGIQNLVGKKIFFHEGVPYENLIAVYSASSICVFPSLAESFGLVAIEAMAAFTPVIYTQNATGREIIKHETEGFLVNPTDSKAIAAAILKLVNMDDHEKLFLIENARAKVESKFTIEKCIDDSMILYKSLIK